MAFNQAEKIRQEEAELEALIQAQKDMEAEKEAEKAKAKEEAAAEDKSSKAKPEEDLNDENEGKEETGWEKRYGDLRRHTQKKEAEFKAKIAELEEKFSKVASGDIQSSLPASPAELEEWKEKDPHGFAVVESIAASIAEDKVKAQMKDFEDVRETLKANTEEIKIGKAELEIKKAHPDYEDLKSDGDFHDWVETQPEMVQNAIYDNTDAKSVIWGLDIYKLAKSKPKSTKKDNAKAVTKSEKPSVDADASKGVIYESEVLGWTEKEFEKNMDRLDEARRTGKYIANISGGAR